MNFLIWRKSKLILYYIYYWWYEGTLQPSLKKIGLWHLLQFLSNVFMFLEVLEKFHISSVEVYNKKWKENSQHLEIYFNFLQGLQWYFNKMFVWHKRIKHFNPYYCILLSEDARDDSLSMLSSGLFCNFLN